MDRKKQFDVEALEPRILLSGEGMAAGISLTLDPLAGSSPGSIFAIEETFDALVFPPNPASRFPSPPPLKSMTFSRGFPGLI